MWQAAAPGEKSESVCETGRTEERQYVIFKGSGSQLQRFLLHQLPKLKTRDKPKHR